MVVEVCIENIVDIKRRPVAFFGKTIHHVSSQAIVKETRATTIFKYIEFWAIKFNWRLLFIDLHRMLFLLCGWFLKEPNVGVVLLINVLFQYKLFFIAETQQNYSLNMINKKNIIVFRNVKSGWVLVLARSFGFPTCGNKAKTTCQSLLLMGPLIEHILTIQGPLMEVQQCKVDFDLQMTTLLFKDTQNNVLISGLKAVHEVKWPLIHVCFAHCTLFSFFTKTNL